MNHRGRFSFRNPNREFPYSIHTTSKVFFVQRWGGGGMYSERKKERRGFSSKTSFPLVTHGGYPVENDRRSTPDRRLGNIQLELIDAVNHEFSEDFTCHNRLTPGNGWPA